MAVAPIQTDRLELISLSAHFIHALLAGRRKEAERLVAVKLPEDWPDEHDARFLSLRLDQMRAKPEWQEWLVRAIVLQNTGRPIVGHIGFHGPPKSSAGRNWATPSSRGPGDAVTPPRQRRLCCSGHGLITE
jgi:hypothetical protein